ncbi:MAG: rhomboid family intramembrane serine protease [Beijerinckiaceae bacterium]|jgi:membrane associated rhomboid family serine protease|nr:rhomboid family intramembrane serine protease [Beijerinckiaceae bacterium]MDO9439674.1 rhomboid family intramembrane serine protease [Beijerinckiaceae bacterium]
MFIPIHDGVALHHIRYPFATKSLLAVNIALYLAALLGILGDTQRIDLGFGFIPAVLFGSAFLSPDLSVVAPELTLLTSMFLHAGFAHIAGNMLFLFVFGDNVEDAMGSLRFFFFYLACGAAAALAYGWMAPESQAPLIGASGAVSGVVVAYLMLYPRVNVLGLVFAWLPLRIRAVWLIGAWILFQLGSALFSADAGVGWWAHVGGMAAGAVLTPFLKRRDVPLFGDRNA